VGSRWLASGYRDYPADAVQWLCYLRSAQALGFTLAEIELGMPMLAKIDPASVTVSPELRAALLHKLADIDARIAGLNLLRLQRANELARPGAVCPLEATAQ
jgi:DNA-binding transcriptional MerR regulator